MEQSQHPRRKNVNKALMAEAILIPIKDFDPKKERVTGKEERIKAMLTNVERHHQIVKANILHMQKKKSPNNAAQPQPLPRAPPEVYTSLQHRPDPLHSHKSATPRPIDPSMLPTVRNSLLALDPATFYPSHTPADVKLAVEKYQALEAYNAHAKETKDGLLRMLQRYSSGDYTWTPPVPSPPSSVRQSAEGTAGGADGGRGGDAEGMFASPTTYTPVSAGPASRRESMRRESWGSATAAATSPMEGVQMTAGVQGAGVAPVAPMAPMASTRNDSAGAGAIAADPRRRMSAGNAQMQRQEVATTVDASRDPRRR